MQAAGQCCTLVSAQGAAEPAACSGPGPGGQQPLLGIVSQAAVPQGGHELMSLDTRQPARPPATKHPQDCSTGP